MKIVYAIPGLGTTGDLFKYIELKETELKVLDWPQLEEGETLKSLALKMAKGVDDSKPFYLMGVSFGGMLCTEIAKIKRPLKTILISSCKCRKELPLIFRFFRYFPIHRLVPESHHRILAKNSRRLLGFSRSFINEFHQMIDSMGENYFRRSINCIVNWDGTECSNNNIIHIHGNGDRLINYRKVKADHCIEKGSHAMIVNRADEISKILNEYLKG
jgi:hypothetical protein